MTDHIMVGQVIALRYVVSYQILLKSARSQQWLRLASIDCFVRSQHPQCAVGRPDSLSLLGACAVHLYFAQCLCDRQYSVSRRGQKSCGSSVVRHQTAIWRRLWANCGSCFSTCQKPAMMSYRLLSVGYQTACLTPDVSV